MTYKVKCSNCKCTAEYSRTIVVNNELVCYKCTLKALQQIHVRDARRRRVFGNEYIERGRYVSR